MTRLLSAALTSGLLAFIPSAALAADASVIGDWLVKDGYANIRIDNCGGKMYSASISLADENTLDLEGCLVWPLCQTQKWTRVKSLPPNAAPLPPLPATTKQAPPVKKGAAAPPPQSEVCLRVAAETPPAAGAGSAKK